MSVTSLVSRKKGKVNSVCSAITKGYDTSKKLSKQTRISLVSRFHLGKNLTSFDKNLDREAVPVIFAK